MLTPARRAAFEILLRAETQSSYAGELLHGSLTQELSEREAALCTELTLGSLRWQGLLDFLARSLAKGKWERFDPEVRVALRVGLYQLRFLSRIPASAAVNQSVELIKAAGKSSATGLVNAVLRKAANARLTALRPTGMADFEWHAIETSHPAWLLERWINRFGLEQALALADANNRAPATFLRPSTPRATAELTERLRQEGVATRPGTYLKECLAVQRGNAARTEVFRSGEVVIQDEGSQIVPHLLDVREGHCVLDLCAAPGNKTGMLAQWAVPIDSPSHPLSSRGVPASRGDEGPAFVPGYVVACDIHLHRLRQVSLPPSLTNVHLVALDGEQPLPFGGVFDRVLVDAPCSGTGTLRRNPELKWRLRPSDIPSLAATQLRLLENAAAVLQPGGRMVYSTCSLEREENQDVVERFLTSHPEFRLLPLREDAARLRPSFRPAAERLFDADYLETSPARDACDGFFAAILVKAT